MKEDESHRTTVERVIAEGPHGPYAIARFDELGSITFSLTSPTWEEEGWPGQGEEVILSDIRKKRAGWRAYRGRFVRPSDEESSNPSKEKGAAS